MKFNKISALVLALSTAGAAQAALTAGDIAIIGRTNNGTPDAFSFVALSNINAGEVIYFTDNGWTGSAFRNTVNDGDGNENLLKWTAASTITAGTIINTNISSGFTTSGAVPNNVGGGGSFASLALANGGDQIYAFQANGTNLPLSNISVHLFAFDDTNGFENATGTGDGNVPTGLVNGTTAVSINGAVAGTHALKASFLTESHTRAEWLSIIGTASNWSTASALPAGTLAITAVPEPTSGAIALAGLAVAGLVARRRKAA